MTFFFVTLGAPGQTLPNEFAIGNFLEVFHLDTLKVHFNCTGAVTDRRCAEYYRMGRMDSIHINVCGEFRDYTVNGKLALKANMRDNFLEGRAQYFYENGQVREDGQYSKDLREGRWTYYYPDGVVEKVLDFTGGEPRVMEAYSKNGRPTVLNGQGKFRTEFSNFKQCDSFEAWGEIKNGMKDGKWTFYNSQFRQFVSNEIYNEGVFIEGYSSDRRSDRYTDQPRISLTKFCANENLHLDDNHLGCPGDKGIFYWTYDHQNIHETFYPDLRTRLSKYESRLDDQWVIVGIKINERDEMSGLEVASSKKFLDKVADEGVRDDCYALIKMMSRLTGEKPKMWGPSIIGFGQYHYKYASGHEGYSALAAFSPRKGNLTVYAMPGFSSQPGLVKKLGKYKASKGCLYFKRLGDVDQKVLEKLVRHSIDYVRKTYPG